MSKLAFLDRRTKVGLASLFVLAVVTAVVEAAGVMSIFPLITVITRPDIIQSNEIIRGMYSFIDPANDREFLLVLSIGSAIITLVSLVLKSSFHYFQYRISLMMECTVGVRLLSGYLNKPYVWHLNRHSGELVKNILSQTGIVIAEVMLPFIAMVAHGLIVLAVLIILLWIYPLVTLLVAGVFGFAYAIPLVFLKKLAVRTGAERMVANELRFKLAGEILGGAKEVKIFNAEKEFVKRFGVQAKAYALKAATGKAISILPKYILEGLAFLSLLSVIVYSIVSNADVGLIVPAISTFAVAAYKLMPSLQHVYSSAMTIGHSWGAYEELKNELTSFRRDDKKFEAGELPQIMKAVAFDRVSFSFDDSASPVIRNLSITFPVNTSVGLVGPSGSGKTTIADILSGLHTPVEGSVLCDQTAITSSNLVAWRKKISYVPQNIFLMDASIAENIAFGVPLDSIDWTKIESTARRANIYDFVINELPDKFLTVVGERGVRLSGGQRQRIGLARALYREAEIIILDEATSALDNVTENIFMNNIDDLKIDRIIVIIAHRLSTIENCDHVYFIKEGVVLASGNYQSLQVESADFKRLISGEFSPELVNN